jgi:hypothetical protein
VLPFITSLKTIEQATVDANTNATAVADSKAKVLQLEEARKGWQGILDRDDQLYLDARDKKLKAVTKLVADALLQDENDKDNVKYINGTDAPDANALRDISAIRHVVNLDACPFLIV